MRLQGTPTLPAATIRRLLRHPEVAGKVDATLAPCGRDAQGASQEQRLARKYHHIAQRDSWTATSPCHAHNHRHRLRRMSQMLA